MREMKGNEGHFPFTRLRFWRMRLPPDTGSVCSATSHCASEFNPSQEDDGGEERLSGGILFRQADAPSESPKAVRPV